MDKGEIFFHISIASMLFALVVFVGYEMIFVSEAYLKALGI